MIASTLPTSPIFVPHWRDLLPNTSGAKGPKRIRRTRHPRACASRPSKIRILPDKEKPLRHASVPAVTEPNGFQAVLNDAYRERLTQLETERNAAQEKLARIDALIQRATEGESTDQEAATAIMRLLKENRDQLFVPDHGHRATERFLLSRSEEATEALRRG